MPRKSSNTVNKTKNPVNATKSTKPTVVKEEKPVEKKQRKPRAKKETSTVKEEKPSSEQNTELLVLKKEWINITQEITKMRNSISELEDKRLLITNKITKLIDSDNTDDESPITQQVKPKTQSKKKVVKKKPEPTIEVDSEDELSGSDTSSSDSESEEDISEVSLSESSDSLSESSSDESD